MMHLRWCKSALVYRGQKLYLVGYYHLREELDAKETGELAELIDRWRDRVIVETTISLLQIYDVNDDLALTSRVHAEMSAGGAGRV